MNPEIELMAMQSHVRELHEEARQHRLVREARKAGPHRSLLSRILSA